MKTRNFLLYTLVLSIGMGCAFADVFESNQAPVEIKLAPAITSSNVTVASKAPETQKTASKAPTIKEVKFNNALVNLDDAQVELRQELAVVNAKYTEALTEKDRAIQNCKNLKKEINAINKKMRNVDKSKKMINKNLNNSN